MASRGVEKYSTFFGSGLRAGHVGRQKIEGVRTPRWNTPLNGAWLPRYARSISGSGGREFRTAVCRSLEDPLHRFSGADVDFTRASSAGGPRAWSRPAPEPRKWSAG